MSDSSLVQRFTWARWGAHRRGIAWKLTYQEWLQIWENSGHLNERGCRKGQWVMARHGDEGPYEVGNVAIVPVEENNSQAGCRPRRNVEHRSIDMNGGRLTQITLRLSEDVLDRLRDVAERDRRPYSTVARLALEDWTRAGCPDLRRQSELQHDGAAA